MGERIYTVSVEQRISGTLHIAAESEEEALEDAMLLWDPMRDADDADDVELDVVGMNTTTPGASYWSGGPGGEWKTVPANKARGANE